jgi:hypothetical protein
MKRDQLLAAEIFGYSYANYQDHLGIGNVRYERLMPETVNVLARAAKESWPLRRLADELDTDPENAEDLLDGYRRAVQVVDAADPAESFRSAVRFVIQDAVAEGLSTDEEVERLVIQVCYRAADLAYLLKQRGETLARYSRHLRREPDVEYYEAYFDEEE